MFGTPCLNPPCVFSCSGTAHLACYKRHLNLAFYLLDHVALNQSKAPLPPCLSPPLPQHAHRAPTGASLGLPTHGSTRPSQDLGPGCSLSLEHPSPRTSLPLSPGLCPSAASWETPSPGRPTELSHTPRLPAHLCPHRNPPSKEQRIYWICLSLSTKRRSEKELSSLCPEQGQVSRNTSHIPAGCGQSHVNYSICPN